MGEFLKSLLKPGGAYDNMVMSPEYAGAMVTVIPVIILLGGAEIGALLNRRQQNRERIDGLIHAAQERCLGRIQAGQTPDAQDLQISRGAFPYDGESSRLTITYWIGSCAAAFLAESMLIFWLATEEKPKSNTVASVIAIAALNGFAMVLFGVYSLITDSRSFNKLLRANSQPRAIDPALAAWLILPEQQQHAPGPSSADGA